MQLVANHPWFGSRDLASSVKADLHLICSAVCHNSDHIVRGTGSSLKTVSTLPRPIRPIFNKISNLHFIICIFQVFQEAMVSLKSIFRSNKQNGALHVLQCFPSINQTRRKSILRGIRPCDRCP